jgi:hypothetical protein
LHHPALDVSKPLDETVAAYFNGIGVAVAKPLDKEAPDPTLLILDGLDELSRAGQVGERVIQSFVGEITALQTTWNHGRDRAQLLVLLCGRPVAVDAIKADVRAEDGILNLWPYLVDRGEVTRPRHGKAVELAGEESLLEADQRRDWWEKYATARGQTNGAEAYELLRKRKDLEPITAQPLLNYLVAFLASPSGGVSALPGHLCTLYGQLLRRIWERGWEKQEQVPALKGVRFEEFTDLLESIALAAWHAGNTRSIRATLVDRKLTADQRTLLSRLEQTTAGGILRLLLSFFFRPLGRDEVEWTYEFTHKTFAEYLVARLAGRKIEELTADWKEAGGRGFPDSAVRLACGTTKSVGKWRKV